jgi:hypothetical protein
VLQGLGESAPEDLLVELGQLAAEGRWPVSQGLQEALEALAQTVGDLEGDQGPLLSSEGLQEASAWARTAGQETEVEELVRGQPSPPGPGGSPDR